MTEKFKKNQSIKIIPEDVHSSCSAKIKETKNDSIIIKTNTCIKEGDCECFSTTASGIVYFKSKIQKNDNDLYTILPTKNYTIMQRREYSRISLKQDIQLLNGTQSIKAIITDISAGGMQILSNTELKMSETYNINIKLGNDIMISTNFLPIRQEKTDVNQYIISGKFQQISHKDKITLIQYCFSRLMENTNK